MATDLGDFTISYANGCLKTSAVNILSWAPLIYPFVFVMCLFILAKMIELDQKSGGD